LAFDPARGDVGEGPDQVSSHVGDGPPLAPTRLGERAFVEGAHELGEGRKLLLHSLDHVVPRQHG
jgi:hypothetical protein